MTSQTETPLKEDIDARLSAVLRTARERGNSAAALPQLRQLANEPDATHDVFDALSQLCLTHGLIDEATAASERAVALDPSQPDTWHRLGIIHMQRQQAEAAREALERAVALRPDFAKALNNLGFVLQHLGLNAMAVERYGQALAANPDYAEAHSNLASALALAGRYDDALTHAKRAIELSPGYISPYMHAAFIETDRQRFDEALAWIDRLPREAMRNALVLTACAEILIKADRHEEALVPCREAIELQPNLGDAFLCRGRALSALGRRAEALIAFDRAIALMPASAGPLAWKASVMMELGRTSEATDLFDRARSLEPRMADVIYMHAAANEFRLKDAQAAELEALLADEQITSASERTQLHFTLANAYLRSGESKKVFAHLHAGNRIKRSTIDYDPDAVEQQFLAIAAAYPASRVRSADGSTSQIPIFVAGMPRSGTTLVEQILASHPKVHGAGELRAMGAVTRKIQNKYEKLYPHFAADLNAEYQRAAGAEYLAQIGRPPDGKQHIVDKMPSNALFAGLIHQILPNARIILCRRNPFDTCFSCYSTLFAAHQNFTYNLEELGRYYRAHDALMAHWREVLPKENFLEINYEDVVEDIEGMARRLVAFCGLEWSEDCLRFYESKRPVRTASMLQVRKPLYRDSVGRWRQFEAELAPLLVSLAQPVRD